MPVPQGDITTSEILVPEVVPVDEAIVAADAEVAVEEYVVEKPAPKKRAKKV
jgi:predicted house-cleaning NTP pyrophosphatase (Maf/HAM1 superfamily)